MKFTRLKSIFFYWVLFNLLLNSSLNLSGAIYHNLNSYPSPYNVETGKRVASNTLIIEDLPKKDSLIPGLIEIHNLYGENSLKLLLPEEAFDTLNLGQHKSVFYTTRVYLSEREEMADGTRLYSIEIRRSFNWMPLFVFFGLAFLFLFSVWLYKRVRIKGSLFGKKSSVRANVLAFHSEDPEMKIMAGSVNPVQKGTAGKISQRWDKYDIVTVLFSDIQGFTRLAEQMNPEVLVDELDRFFFNFDSVVEKYNIEKIKTIGDAYMAAGGIPRKNRSNPVEVILAALEMQEYMRRLKKTKVNIWDLRIGIHTGPVIAGNIGHLKRSYDIWGDTVNTASRMESSGEPGKINISGETYNLVKDYFLCEYRGKVPVKYKGNLDMYFIKGIRPELSINLAGIPNRKFFLKLQLLRLEDLEDMIFTRLRNETPHSLHFHTEAYARHIYDYSELLAKAENMDMEEVLLLRTATLLIPSGYLEDYKNPARASSIMAEEMLKSHHYSEKQIGIISNLILSSRSPMDAASPLEKLIIDICFEYYGRSDFLKLNRLLYLENIEFHNKLSYTDWKNKQIDFLSSFRFYSLGAKRLCEIPFTDQISRLINEK